MYIYSVYPGIKLLFICIFLNTTELFFFMIWLCFFFLELFGYFLFIRVQLREKLPDVPKKKKKKKKKRKEIRQ